MKKNLDFIPDALKKKLIKLNKECECPKTAYQPKRKIINGIIFSNEDTVLGNETEYLIVPNADMEEQGDKMIKDFFAWFRSKYGILWVEDGAKIYIDGHDENNCVLEVSSPECKSIKTLTSKMKITNFYANWVLNKFLLQAGVCLNTNWFVVKRKLNPSGDKGVGEHVNIQINHHKELIKKAFKNNHDRAFFYAFASPLPPKFILHGFLLSLSALAGSGWIGQSVFFNNKTKYLMSPSFEILKRLGRLHQMSENEITAKMMQGNYAVDGFSRTEIVTYSDANLGDKSIRLKFGCLMLYLKGWEFHCLSSLKKIYERRLDFGTLDFGTVINPLVVTNPLKEPFHSSNIVCEEAISASFYDGMMINLLNFDFRSKYQTIFGEKNLVEHQEVFLGYVKHCLERTPELNYFFERNFGCAPLKWPLETMEIIKEWQGTLNNLKNDFLLEGLLDWVAIMKKIAKELKCHPLELNEKLDDEALAKKAMQIDFSCRRVDNLKLKIKKADWRPPNKRAFVRQKLFEFFRLLKKIPELKKISTLLGDSLGQRFDGLIEEGTDLRNGFGDFKDEEIHLFKEILSSDIISNLTEYFELDEERKSICRFLPAP